jgi:2'-5' RNA ligase
VSSKRLFVAVDLDEPTRAAAARISTALREHMGLPGRISWVPQDRLHLTLHFLGGADEALERSAVAAMAEPIPQEPFAVTFQGVGCFPSHGSPRVLWLGVGAGRRELAQVHEEIGRRLGVPGHVGQSFNPHLTLARFRDRVARGLASRIGDTAATVGPCRIDRVTLYESRISSAGRAYVPLGEARLKP